MSAINSSFLMVMMILGNLFIGAQGAPGDTAETAEAEDPAILGGWQHLAVAWFE